MNRFRLVALLICAATLALSACREPESVALPKPVALTIEAVAHYCQMNVLEHPGPKAQIHLAGNPHPIWFTQIRDAIAFTLLPEEVEEISVVYVTDMAKTAWENPKSASWVAAQDAFYVIESKRQGGMGAPEAVPFAAQEAADSFVARHGGRVVGLDDIPEEYVLAPVELPDLPVGAEG